MKKNILISDDSALMRRVICDIIHTDDRLQVVDIAKDGVEAFGFLLDKKYDAVILDINMPRMTGLELLEKLQKNNIKATVIVVSTLVRDGAKETIRALELGAFDFVTKPISFIEAKGEDFKTNLLKAIFLATKLDSGTGGSLFSMGLGRRSPSGTGAAKPAVKPVPKIIFRGDHANKLIALACSTGGPKSLQTVIPKLPKNLDAAVVLVQHMPAGFTQSLAQRLNEMSMVDVKEAENNDVIQKGKVYIAPGSFHLSIVKEGGSHKIKLSKEDPIGGLRPCANIMYESLIRCSFDTITCVVLTGMGADGTQGITKLNKSKPLYVIAQDEASSVVYGMPKSIAEAGLVDEVVSLDNVSKAIIKNVGVQ